MILIRSSGYGAMIFEGHTSLLLIESLECLGRD